MIKSDSAITPQDLAPAVDRLFELSASKIVHLERTWDPGQGTPVFTVQGKYTTRGWTEWTQGFLFGFAILQFDATGDEQFLDIGRKGTVKHMATHVSHVGVHDHGFRDTFTRSTARTRCLSILSARCALLPLPTSWATS
jgi:hypothetical protein